MSARQSHRLAWSAFLLWVLFFVGSFAFSVAAGPIGGTGDLVFGLSVAAFPIVGILILTRQPGNSIGWILMGIGLAWALPFGSYGDFALARDLPGGAASIAIAEPLWAPAIGIMGTFLILRFPDGAPFPLGGGRSKGFPPWASSARPWPSCSCLETCPTRATRT